MRRRGHADPGSTFHGADVTIHAAQQYRVVRRDRYRTEEAGDAGMGAEANV